MTLTLDLLNNRTDWTVIEDTFDENVYNDSILEMYTMLEYSKDTRIKALITYRDSTTYPLACDKWAIIYWFNADGKCYNTIRGYLGYIDR